MDNRLSSLSIWKTGHYFASAKYVLTFSPKFFEYKETKLLDFARPFPNWTTTLLSIKYIKNGRQTVCSPTQCGAHINTGDD